MTRYLKLFLVNKWIWKLNYIKILPFGKVFYKYSHTITQSEAHALCLMTVYMYVQLALTFLANCWAAVKQLFIKSRTGGRAAVALLPLIHDDSMCDVCYQESCSLSMICRSTHNTHIHTRADSHAHTHNPSADAMRLSH